jgi:hypothetical protein
MSAEKELIHDQRRVHLGAERGMRISDVFKPFVLPDTNQHAWFFEMQGGDGSMSLELKKYPIQYSDFKYTEAELDQVVVNILKTLPKVYVGNIVDIQRARNNVARVTRRGGTNIRYGNIYFYAGRETEDGARRFNREFKPYDSPIGIYLYDGLYAIVKHPYFDTMGFVSNHTEEDFIFPEFARYNNLDVLELIDPPEQKACSNRVDGRCTMGFPFCAFPDCEG